MYRANPSKNRRLTLRARFDRIFRRRTGFVTLDRLLKRLHANKSELLMVLDRPETPLHTNGSENDIRCCPAPIFRSSIKLVGLSIISRLPYVAYRERNTATC